MSVDMKIQKMERNVKQELYTAWKGQLFIQDQQVCDIVLASPFRGSIPVQLPARLEIRYVVRVSELRKKLPKDAFGKSHYINHKVSSQDILFYLYEVEILNQNEQKLDLLIESLKERDLALIKCLNDQGILILLASSALIKEKDESTCLQALFLISSARSECLTAKDLKDESGRSEQSLQIALVLPGLQHALAEVVKHPIDRRASPSALLKLHIQEFAKLDEKSRQTCDNLGKAFSFDVYLQKTDLELLSEKCPQDSVSHLQCYLSHPENYVLEMPTALACLDSVPQNPSSGPGQGADCCPYTNADSTLPEVGENIRPRRALRSDLRSKDAAAEPVQVADRPLQRSKRKSGRLLGASARKKWSPMKVLCIMESNKKRKKKKKMSLSDSPSKNSGSPAADPSEPTVKLKKLQNPLRRKRGAEVLSLEFVQRTKCESPAKAVSSSDDVGVEEKKARLLKDRGDAEAQKTTSMEKMSTRSRMKRRNACCETDETPVKSEKEAYDDKSLGKETVGADASLETNECDSHALNMLADLALSSCSSPLLSNGNGVSVPINPPRERCRLLKGKLLFKSSDHEYHRITKKCKVTPPSGKICQESPLPPRQMEPSAEPPNSQEKSGVTSNRKASFRPSVAKPHTALPKESGNLLDSSMNSLISSEHSYASLVSESSRKGLPSSPSSRNGVQHAKPGPLLGKVLPFRHQQNICHPPRLFKNYMPFVRSAIMAARYKDDFSSSHKVTLCNETVKVTFQREAEYLFSLDSKYTNNSLEKTVVRAVHGPWDVSLSDDAEEMKLILHMWVALFYCKPFKSPTVRKVVEHRNPAKYVSLNSVVDPLDLTDDCEGSFRLEKCAADSLSETDQASGEAEGRAPSPSEKPLSCNELSSTNSIEEETSFINPKESSDVCLKEEQPSSPAKDSADTTPSWNKVAGEKPAGEFLPDPASSVEVQKRNSSVGCGEKCLSLQEDRLGGNTKGNRDVNLVEVSQSVTVSARAESTETMLDASHAQPAAAQASPLEYSWKINPAEEAKPRVFDPESLYGSKAAWLGANTECKDNESLCREPSQSQILSLDEDDGEAESMQLESIDLTLSDSNDADAEPQEEDLDEENEELYDEAWLAGEREMASLSSVTSPECTSVTSPSASSEHQAQLSSTTAATLEHQTVKDSVGSPSKSTLLNSRDLVKTFCLLKDDGDDKLVDPESAEDNSAHQEAELSAKCSSSPNQLDAVENTCCSMVADSFVSVEDEKNNLNSSHLTQVSPVHREAPRGGTALLKDQKDAKGPLSHCVAQNQMDFIEEISQDDPHMCQSSPLQICEQHQGQVEPPRNEESEVASALNLSLGKEMGKSKSSSFSQDINGVHQTHTVPPQAVHRMVSDVVERPRNQEDSPVPAKNIALQEKVHLAEDSFISREAETDPPPKDKLNQAEYSAIAEKEPATRQLTGVKDSSFEEREYQSLELSKTIREADSENKEHYLAGRYAEVSHVSQEVDASKQEVITIAEDIRATVCGLVDTVCTMATEREEMPVQETSSSNWINSVTLECVTPPDSDEENVFTNGRVQTDPSLMSSGYLKQHSLSVGRYRSALFESMSYHCMDMLQGQSLQVSGFAPSAMDASSNSCTERSPQGEAAVPTEGGNFLASNFEAHLGQNNQRVLEEGDRCRETASFKPVEHQTECSSKDSDLLIQENTGKSLEDIPGNGKEQFPSQVEGINAQWEERCFSVDGGQESFGDPCQGSRFERPGTRSINLLEDSEPISTCDSSCDKEMDKSADWMYLENTEQILDVESKVMPYGWSFAGREEGRPVPPPLKTDNKSGPLKDYVNFSITMKHKEKTRTFHASKRRDSFAGELGFINSSYRTLRVLNDSIQNTLDLECLRFHYKLKHILTPSQLSTSSDSFTKELSPPAVADMLPLRKAPEVPLLSSRSPLLITIANPGPRPSTSACYPRGWRQYGDAFEPSGQESVCRALRTKSQGHGPVAPTHLKKLTYSNKLQDSQGDISVIMDEFAELRGVMALSAKMRDSNTTSEDAPKKSCLPYPKRTPSYEHLFTELCETLHFRLKNVAQEACKKPYMFYLVEVDNDPFFGQVKNVLKKGGHTETKPLHFCKANHPEEDRLMVIIRNEDIFPCIHKIPSLLRLKRFPNVTFAGVDSPEDVLNNTYQELFHSGGFVVSDDKLLETLTVGELKDIVKTLEALKSTGKWKWFLHYREFKKLREDSRVNSVAHAKELLLKSCQGGNIIEVLHYHQCDSKSSSRSKYLNCLLHLQVQHISRRFATFLTEKLSTSREALENMGVLVLDVNTFIATAQDMAIPFGSGCWKMNGPFSEGGTEEEGPAHGDTFDDLQEATDGDPDYKSRRPLGRTPVLLSLLAGQRRLCEWRVGLEAPDPTLQVIPLRA